MMDKDNFIRKAIEKHNGFYTYENVAEGRYDEKVMITCPIHGDFPQTPHSHLKGSGCSKCGRDRRRKTLAQFIEDANKVHKNKYSYKKSIYVDTFTPLIVTCPKHGDFIVSPNAHTAKKQGCPHCTKEKDRAKRHLGKDLFIEKAKEVHGDKYDYSKVNYVNNNSKVCIVCPIHGEFSQSPHSHLQGSGCPCCKESKLERKIKLFLEENNIEYVRQFNDSFLGNQKLDFYLPKHNIAIECQGTQHVRGKWFRDKHKPSHSDNIIESDIKKHNNCKNNGIKLLYFANRKSEKEKLLTEDKFQNIYNSNNTFTSLTELLEKIKGG
jgi:very-short-patch-repair endonuclease